MSNNGGKSFEERLHSLKVGCTIFGVCEVILLIFNLISLSSNTNGSTIFTVVLIIVRFCLLYFMYKYTKDRDSLGPILEYIFGIILLVNGILFCISIVFIILGILEIILAIGVFSEAKYFKSHIEEIQ